MPRNSGNISNPCNCMVLRCLRMTMQNVLSACVTALILSGCVSKEVNLTTPFNPAQARYAATNGTAIIDGQAFMRQRGGGGVTAAGEPVLLLPDVPHVEQMFSEGLGHNVSKINNLDQRLKDYVKKTTADASGNFSFQGLSAGKYIVATRVRWQAGDIGQGGDLMERVTVKPSERVRVIMHH